VTLPPQFEPNDDYFNPHDYESLGGGALTDGLQLGSSRKQSNGAMPHDTALQWEQCLLWSLYSGTYIVGPAVEYGSVTPYTGPAGVIPPPTYYSL